MFRGITSRRLLYLPGSAGVLLSSHVLLQCGLCAVTVASPVARQGGARPVAYESRLGDFLSKWYPTMNSPKLGPPFFSDRTSSFIPTQQLQSWVSITPHELGVFQK